MHRLTSSSRAPEEFVSIQMPQNDESPHTNTEDIGDIPPISDPCCIARRRKSLSHRYPQSFIPAAEKWVHCIPVIVLLVLFILWWFSYPVEVGIKDGHIDSINSRKMLRPYEIHGDILVTSFGAQPTNYNFP